MPHAHVCHTLKGLVANALPHLNPPPVLQVTVNMKHVQGIQVAGRDGNGPTDTWFSPSIISAGVNDNKVFKDDDQSSHIVK